MRPAIVALRLGAGALMGVSAYTRRLESRQGLAAYNNQESYFRWNPNWDRRDPKGYLEPPQSDSAKDIHEYQAKLKGLMPSASRHLLLVRHGQYTEAPNFDKDRILTKLGRCQADMTGERLKELGLPYNCMTASTMTRAQETARLIQVHIPHLEITHDQCLSEGAPILPDPVSANWKPTPDQFFQDSARIESAFRKYFHRADPEQKDDSYELIVCHSNVIRYFICRVLQFPLEGWIRVSMANCSMTLITIHPDGSVVMEMMGDHGHIPPESVTFQ